MMREIAAAISLTLAAGCAMAQSPQPAPVVPAAATPVPAAAVPSPDADLTIHYKGPGVTAPEFLSFNGKSVQIDRCKKVDGEERLLIAVDGTGIPQTIEILKSRGNDLETMARHVVELDKFKPGSVGGEPAIVAEVDDMKIESCRVERTGENREKEIGLELRSAPEQAFELVETPKNAVTELPLQPGSHTWSAVMHNLYRVGGGVTAPVITHQAFPLFTGEARKAKYQGICVVSIIVDVNGNPQNPRIVRPIGMGLDEKAIEAVKQFRFKPAMKDGKTPVPVMITVEINFRLY